MQDCKPVSTPLVPGLRLSKPDEANHVSPKNIPYQELIGSLMYLAVYTRPDIAYATSYLSQFNNCYGEEHYQALKRVLRYLKGTSNLGLKFKKNGVGIQSFVDADHGGDITDRKSYSGFVFKLSSGPVSWESRKQTIVALSSAEAEYISLSNAAKEAVSLKCLYKELTGFEKSVVVYCDSQSAIAIANNLSGSNHRHTKHIDLKVHHIKDMVQKKEIELCYLDTGSMIADVFTNPLPLGKLDLCVKGMGMI